MKQCWNSYKKGVLLHNRYVNACHYIIVVYPEISKRRQQEFSITQTDVCNSQWLRSYQKNKRYKIERL